jgi:predicted transcriptional regulator
LVDMTEEEHDSLMHIGIKRRSGRYPWGSGNDPYQRSNDFKSYYDGLKSKGYSEAEIAKYTQETMRLTDPHAKFNTADLRAAISSSTEVIRNANHDMAIRLKNAPGRQMSTSAIARQMGVNESTVRGWLKASEEIKNNSIQAVVNMLKEHLTNKPYLDVGKGTHLYLGITETKLKTALASLKDEGFHIHTDIKQPQLGTDKQTSLKVLTKDSSWKNTREAVINKGMLRNVTDYSDDGGFTFHQPKDLPVSVSTKRVSVRFAEDGGTKMDGVIELRRGVPDLDLGANRYGQVRIAVNGTHYLKGMAMYADDMPPGVDIRFNTNKPKSTGVLGSMKKLEIDPTTGEVDVNRPFGSTTSPRVYTDKNGKEKTSPLNLVGTPGSENIEGRWDEWSRSLSSQMLSKQPIVLASQQLGKAQASRKKELDDINAMTNPVVRKKLLEEYADSADAAAVHLKAAAFDRQSTHVILPMNSMRPNEIYAPNFNNGDKVVLVRHPHAGPFEIPELTVNNKNPTARRILGTNARDAVGIHHTVAEQLSGADFDGDTVLVIHNDEGRVKTAKPLKDLEGFSPKDMYTIPKDDTTTVRMTKKNTQTEMGRISNLITDMSIHRAPDDEMARAVKHSMVVIDAEKHELDYKRSEADNRIGDLRATYQEKRAGGASTLISRAGSPLKVPQFEVPSGARGIDPATGRRVRIPTGRTYVSKKTGETVTKTTTVKRLDFTDDATTLLSDRAQPIERTYAQHSNTMKALANSARLSSLSVRMPTTLPRSKELYADEVTSLTSKLRIAQRNAPLERQAQNMAGARAKEIVDAHPEYDDDTVKKVHYAQLSEARAITGAAKQKVYITDREWEAIQARAVPHTKLSEILNNADMDRVKELATPKSRSSLTPGQIARARNLAALGRPMTQIAEELGIPRTTIIDNLNR